jgi:WD40 repeat protein
VIHESLLKAWPRLVRWQAQDAEGALLRDQLRQAAAAWDERGRVDDLLWTGAAYREYVVWRERYPGGLTEVEEAFASAMTSLATRRKRRRRIAVTASFLVLLTGLAVVGALWRRSVLETRRAEAQKLLALGQLELESFPTAALAWARASLGLADTLEARLLVVRALSKGPPVTVLELPEGAGQVERLAFSPNGEWLAGGSPRSTQLWFHDGTPARIVEEIGEAWGWFGLAFASNDLLITNRLGTHRWWSVSDVREPVSVEENRGGLVALRGDGYFSTRRDRGDRALYWWPLDGGPPRVIAAGDLPSGGCIEIGPSGSRLAFVDGNRLMIRNLDDWDEEPRLVGELSSKPGGCRLAFAPDGSAVAAVVDGTRRLVIWPLGDDAAELPRKIDSDDAMFLDVEFGPGGLWLVANTLSTKMVQAFWILDLDAPRGVEPLALRKTGFGYDNSDQVALHPSGDWLVTSDLFRLTFWPMQRTHPWVFDLGGRVSDVAFTPDGRWLLSLTDGTGSGAGGAGGQLRAWPLAGQNGGEPRLLLERPKLHFYWAKLVLDPSGDRVAVPDQTGRLYVLPVSGGPVRELTCPDEAKLAAGNFVLSFSPDGRYLAFVPFLGPSEETPVHAWDLVTDDVRPVGTVSGTTGALRFVDARRLLWAGSTIHGIGTGGEKVFDIETGEETVVSRSGSVWAQTVSPDESSILRIHVEGSPSDPKTTLVWEDPESGDSRTVLSHGDQTVAATFDPSGRWIVSSAFDGTVRVGPVAGDEPHLLLGHARGAGVAVSHIAVSPDGQWIASGGEDKTMRVWPMPDFSKPPLHTLPREELIAKLKTLTNLRVVRDEESSAGWTLEVGPFPGWETVPTW